MQIEKEGIPQEAMDLFNRSDELHRNKVCLQRIVEWYNLLQDNCTQVELDMIEKDLSKIDGMIDEIIDKLTWEMDSK